MPLPTPRTSILVAILCVLIAGCAPSPTAGTDDMDLTLRYKNNISMLYGVGKKVTFDSTRPTAMSDIKWKDSLGIDRSLADLNGSVVLLNFWATWCTYCREEMPDLNEVQEEQAVDDVRVIGISIDRTKRPFETVETEVVGRYTYQMVVDPEYKSYSNYGGDGNLPYTVVIDRDGIVRFTARGRLSREQIENYIDAVK